MAAGFCIAQTKRLLSWKFCGAIKTNILLTLLLLFLPPGRGKFKIIIYWN